MEPRVAAPLDAAPRTALPAAARVLDALAAQGVRPRRITADSRTVGKGDVFAAYPGTTTDGRRFIQAAIQSGAGAILWESAGTSWAQIAGAGGDTPNVGVENLRRLGGPIASLVYGNPSHDLWTVGVTGTNGKTSTTQWVAQALGATGRRCAVIGTLGAGFPGALEALANTTPEAIGLQECLAALRGQGAEAVAMEVSSIGLDQGRTDGIAFRCAVLTNVTHDHLDYHGSMDSYRTAKLRLFEEPTLTHAVLNLDDPFGTELAALALRSGTRSIGYTLSEQAPRIEVDELLQARAIEHREGALRFEACGRGGAFPVSSPAAGRFNVANLLAVIAVLRASGLALPRAAALASGLQPVAGRMERLGGERRPLVFVDYAHTPDALEKVLAAAREAAQGRGGRLIAVFGCGGDRDRGKRPVMGRIGAALADRVILTSDNPRSEPPEGIIDEIVAGVAASDRGRVDRDADRAGAIAAAILAAAGADVVLIAGKGHETYQEVAGVKRTFSDAAEAERQLARWQP